MDLSAPAEAVAALAPRLRPEQAAATGRLALEAMVKASGPSERGALGRVVAALAPRLEPEQAAEQADVACQLALEAIPRETSGCSPAWWRGTRSGPGRRRSWPSAARACISS